MMKRKSEQGKVSLPADGALSVIGMASGATFRVLSGHLGVRSLMETALRTNSVMRLTQASPREDVVVNPAYVEFVRRAS